MGSDQVIENRPDFLVVAAPLEHPHIIDSAKQGDHHVIKTASSKFEVWCRFLGMRLSIPDQQVELVFCGELYGERPGFQKESLIEAYLQHGQDFVLNLNGSFCLILIDARNGTLIAATDRVNSRKIYMHQSNDYLVLSSSIYLHSTRQMCIDKVAVAWYLANGAFHNNRTPFEEIKVMERASIYEYNEGKLRKNKYWEYCFSNDYASKSYKQLKQELRELLVGAVKKRLPRTSTPIISLSAGYDSTAILGVIGSCLHTREAKCFSYAFGKPSPYSDEFLSRQMAEFYGYQFLIIPSFGGSLKKVIERNAQLGEGTTPFCHEVDSYFELSTQLSSVDEKILFIGDECFGWLNKPMNSYADVLGAVFINDFNCLSWLGKYIESSSIRSLSDAVDQEIEEILQGCPQSDDLHDTKDYIYLDQRLNHVLMSTRQNFPGRFFTVANPLLDNAILDFMKKVPSALRRGKKLYKDTVREMFPEFFKIKRARLSSFTSYLDPALQEQKSDLKSLVESEGSSLDPIVPQEMIVNILREYVYVSPKSTVGDWSKQKIKWFLHDTVWYDWVSSWIRVRSPGNLSVPKFLERAFVLRIFLTGIAKRENMLKYVKS